MGFCAALATATLQAQTPASSAILSSFDLCAICNNGGLAIRVPAHGQA